MKLLNRLFWKLLDRIAPDDLSMSHWEYGKENMAVKAMVEARWKLRSGGQ